MKILFSGHHNPHFWTITEYVEEAIRATGNELISFECQSHILPGRLRQRFQLLDHIDVSILNSRLIHLVWSEKPDIVIIQGGHRILEGTIKRLKACCGACVLWTTDAPIDFEPIIRAASSYDHIVCFGTEAIELLDNAGIKGALLLPMACDPMIHHPVEVNGDERSRYSSDIVFVGSYYHNRAALFERIANYDFAIWGPGWNSLAVTSPLRGKIRGAHTTPDEWIKIYGTSRIVLAIHYQDPAGRVPVYQASARIFEAMACGAFVLCDRQRDVFSLFTDGVDLVGFDDADDMVKKIDFYLAHPEERDKIAETGRKNVIENHTYRHRIEQLLRIVGH